MTRAYIGSRYIVNRSIVVRYSWTACKAHAVQEFCGPVSLGEGNRSLIYVVNTTAAGFEPATSRV
jgi:hypothetical protein